MRDASPAVKQLIAPSTAAQSRTFGREMHFPQVLQVDVHERGVQAQATVQDGIREEDSRVALLGIRDTELVGSKSLYDHAVPLKPFVSLDHPPDPHDASIVKADAVAGGDC